MSISYHMETNVNFLRAFKTKTCKLLTVKYCMYKEKMVLCVLYTKLIDNIEYVHTRVYEFVYNVYRNPVLMFAYISFNKIDGVTIYSGPNEYKKNLYELYLIYQQKKIYTFKGFHDINVVIN